MENFNNKIQMEIKYKNLFNNPTLVFGEGKLKPILALVGEAPGKNEELQRKVFVGKAGSNLNYFLSRLHILREDIYITNVVKHRPFKLNDKTQNIVNRPPNKQELDFYKPYLLEEVSLVKPKYVVTLGNTSLQAITQNENLKIGDVHGNLIEINDLSIFPLYHPASIIYNNKLKAVYEQDLIKLKSLLI